MSLGTSLRTDNGTRPDKAAKVFRCSRRGRICSIGWVGGCVDSGSMSSKARAVFRKDGGFEERLPRGVLWGDGDLKGSETLEASREDGDTGSETREGFLLDDGDLGADTS